MLGAAMIFAVQASASALEEIKTEKSDLKACEKTLCDLVVKKSPADGDLKCALTKTWAKKDLKDGTAAAKLTWAFGDARCMVDLKLARTIVISAVKDPKATLEFPEHAVKCVIEGDKGPTNVTATLAPKAEFEGGKVKKIWVNLKSVDGSTIVKGLAFTAAKLEDKVGVFHSALIKSVNHMIEEKCPRVSAGQ